MSEALPPVRVTSQCIHLSDLVSISPNSSLLQPVLAEVASEVADPAEVALEKDDNGFLAWKCVELSWCLLFILISESH